MRGERRAEEDAGALLGDDDVAGLRLEFGPDRVIGRVDRRLVALGRGDETRDGSRRACRRSNRRSAGRRRARPRTAAWSARSPHRRIPRRSWETSSPASRAAQPHRDRPARRGRPRAARAPARRRSLRSIGGINLQHVRRDDVLPAMVFEIVDHDAAPDRLRGRSKGRPGALIWIEPNGERSLCTF